MEKREEEFSDRKVTIFLIGAILISLVSTATVIISLQEITYKPSKNSQISFPQQASGGGIISLTILEKEQPKNGTQ